MAEDTQGTDTPTTAPINVPDKPALEGLEDALTRRWLDEGTYKFNPDTTREQVYSIDTPPPTASGSLHVGHMFSYTQTDVLARYQRMTGKNVFYPMGWDDNGLPTERRVQNYYGVRCDPTTAYDAGYRPPAEPAKNQRDFDVVSRRNFIELCEELAVEDEKVFENLFQTLGLSVDWDLTYRTIDDKSRAISQRAFLANLAAGDAYMAEAPTLWDVTFRTAVAQAELEDREVAGAYYRYPFFTEDGEKIYIETTRPELLAACAALVANPDDERYQPLFGKKVTSPLFGVEVEVKAHPLAKADKGSGVAMVCTFGDLTDVTWWRELQLPTRAIVGRDGRIIGETPEWITTAEGRASFEAIAGKTVFSAKEAVVELLAAAGTPRRRAEEDHAPGQLLRKGRQAPRSGHVPPVVHPQRRPRRGTPRAAHRPRPGDRLPPGLYALTLRELDLRAERRLAGLPPALLRRAGAGLVPARRRREPRLRRPDRARPTRSCRWTRPRTRHPGYEEAQRDVPGGFTGDADVLDTWATSSLTPQIVGGWSTDEALFAKVYPFDVRPQGHDIIRTWLFSSAVRADALQDSAPWKHAAISGWILDPDRKKMSKSKGNVIVPTDVLEEYGSDAVRYWAASAKLGADTAYEIAQMKIGRRLAIKLLNASKFVLNLGATEDSVVSGDLSVLGNPLDRAVLAQLSDVVQQATKAFENYDYARALQITESFFWHFTDDYVELIKDRAYGAAGEAEQASVLAALATSLDTLLRLFAPFLPFATEEVWSWWRTGSVHRAQWPSAVEIDGDTTLLATVGTALSGIRKAKSEAKVKQRTEVLSATITASESLTTQLKAGLADLKAAANARELTLVGGDGELAVSDVVLAPAEAPAQA